MFRNVLVSGILLLQTLGAALPLNLTGTGDIGLENVALTENTDLDADTTLINGVKIPARLVLMGHAGGYDLSLVTGLYVNRWNTDRLHLDMLTLEAKKKHLALTLGDTYLRQRRTTVMQRRLRGLYGTWAAPGRFGKDLLKVHLAAGQSRRAQDVDSRIAHTDYRRTAASGTFGQYLGWGSVELRPSADVTADVNALVAADDKESISRDTTVTPLFNALVGGHVRYGLLDRSLILDLDYNRSSYRADRNSDADAKGDHAFTVSADARLKAFDLNTEFKYIGADYYTAGYPYLDNDRMGFAAGAAYTAKGLLRTEVAYETYTENLAGDTARYDTKTDILEADLVTAWNKAPNIGLSYSLKKQLSPKLPDETLVDRIYHHLGGNVTVSGSRVRGTFGVSYRLLDENSQLYYGPVDSVTSGDEDTTIFDASGQLSIATGVRVRITPALSLNGGINNVFIANTTRDGTEQKIVANYYYATATASLGGGKYRPVLDLLLTTYTDETAAGQDYLQARTALSLEYRLNRTQSARAKYGFEYRSAVDGNGAMQTDYTANTVGIEYKISF